LQPRSSAAIMFTRVLLSSSGILAAHLMDGIVSTLFIGNPFGSEWVGISLA
jgi:hypothetical protein